ncbi:hypothetical protein NC651_032742 [Populus alba x Populus x berolinensis]|nr:hypothetical protein NC651_032742 [Populus alba x Populus x berolinensis]
MQPYTATSKPSSLMIRNQIIGHITLKKNRNLLKFKKGTAKEKRIKKKKKQARWDHRS